VVLRSNGKGGVVEEEAKGDEPSGSPAADFNHAKDLFDKKAYPDAIAAFSGFLVRYPDNPKAPEATYFRGESYLAKGDYKRAASELETIAKAPSGDRTADALYALSKAYEKLGDKDSADKAKKRLKDEFPKSTAAKKLN
jgi:tol-pal system protein YbgF